MWIIAFLIYPPDAPNGVCFWCKLEVGLGNQIDYFIVWKKVTWIEIDASGTLPDNNLAYREAIYNIGTVLQQAVLNSPFMIIENCTVWLQKAHHFSKAGALPSNILSVRHAVGMLVVTALQCSTRPLAAIAVF